MRELALKGFGGAVIRWHDLYAEEAPDAPARVFLHGLGCNGAFDYLRAATHPALGRRRAVLVDFLGHGGSDRPLDFSYSVADHAATVGAVIDHLGLSGVDLVGHSMGGAIAVQLTADRPELVSRLVLSEPVDGVPGVAGVHAAAYTEEVYVREGFAARIAGEHPSYAARLRMCDPVAIHRSSVSLNGGCSPTWAEMFAGFGIPKGFLYGDENRDRADVAWMRSRDGAPMYEVADAGHDMIHDHFDGYVTALATALAK